MQSFIALVFHPPIIQSISPFKLAMRMRLENLSDWWRPSSAAGILEIAMAAIKDKDAEVSAVM